MQTFGSAYFCITKNAFYRKNLPSKMTPQCGVIPQLRKLFCICIVKIVPIMTAVVAMELLHDPV